MERYLICADDEYLSVPASNVLTAFKLVRALRPRAVVVSDAYACTPATVTHVTVTEAPAPAVHLTPALAAELRELITYNWASEEADYKREGPEANGIFPILQRLRAALPPGE